MAMPIQPTPTQAQVHHDEHRTMTSNAPTAAVKNVLVPYHCNSFMTGIALAAFLSPFAALLWSLYRALDPAHAVGDDHSSSHRRLQDICNVTNGTDSTAAAAGHVGEATLWVDVSSTTGIAAAVALFCLVLYELFRRDPIVGKYVYDRKRLMQPDRTPPPLMLSRSLWPGRDEGEGNTYLACCKVLPALMELIFLNLDEMYTRYSRAAYAARREREARGTYSCCRPGWYHANCCTRNNRPANARPGEEDDFFVDEDGYTFYRGYSTDDNAVYRGNNAIADAAEGLTPPPLWTKGIRDLFPEDDLWPSDYSAAARTEDPRRLLRATMRSLEIEPAEPSVSVANAECTAPVLAGADEESAEPGSNPSVHVAHSGENKHAKSPPAASGDAPPSEPVQSMEVGAHGDATTARGDAPDEAALRLPLLPERMASEGRGDGDRRAVEDAEQETLAYPYRIKYFFLPPGFHTWGNVRQFLKYFFFLPAIVQVFHRTRRPSSSTRDHEDDGQTRGGRRSSAPIGNPGKDLTAGEKELLRCAGLDTYLLVRFARFGFDVTFYPFLVACVCVLPIYQSCKDQNDPGGYFGLTIDVVGRDDKRIIWILVFNVLLYMYILRRLWFEWELFIKLRHNFLSKGDNSFHNSPTYRRIFSNTVMVESVPPTHRSDRNLREVFESLFPGQIEHAEMLIDTSTLEDLVDKRRNAINKYNTLLARYQYECWNHATLRKEGRSGAEPVRPKIWIHGLYPAGQEDAFAHYKKKINDIDKLADKEYCEIVQHRLKWRGVSLAEEEEEEEDTEQADHSIELAAQRIYSILVPSTVREWLGEQSFRTHGTGMVRFRSTAAKQGAVQCNLSGQPYWMITKDAPDPRDLNWSNVGVSRNTLENRKIIVQAFLLLGIFVWSFVIRLVDKLTGFTIDQTSSLFGILDQAIIQEYVPAFAVSITLLLIPYLLFALARHVIHFKSHTECDEFVLMWSTGYRLANIYVTIFGISFIRSTACLGQNPEAFMKALATSGIKQSAVLMNLVIVAAGQETMLQLLQWRSLIKHALVRPLINMNARSRRYLDWLKEAPVLERSFIFGFYAPILSYCLMIAMLYAFMAPVMLAICAIFFWIATKVHTHNALFVFCQPFEGGGKIFYYWNRQVFLALYSSIAFFSIFLLLKSGYTLAVIFLVLMSLLTYFVDRSMTNTFVVNSLHLPINLARVNDEEDIVLLAGSNTQRDGQENFMYRHPVLNQDNWNSTPTWK